VPADAHRTGEARRIEDVPPAIVQERAGFTVRLLAQQPVDLAEEDGEVRTVAERGENRAVELRAREPGVAHYGLGGRLFDHREEPLLEVVAEVRDADPRLRLLAVVEDELLPGVEAISERRDGNRANRLEERRHGLWGYGLAVAPQDGREVGLLLDDLEHLDYLFVVAVSIPRHLEDSRREIKEPRLLIGCRDRCHRSSPLIRLSRMIWLHRVLPRTMRVLVYLWLQLSTHFQLKIS